LRPRVGLGAPSDLAALAILSWQRAAQGSYYHQGQFGVGMPSRLDFIIHSAMADMERHEPAATPTRARITTRHYPVCFQLCLQATCRSALEGMTNSLYYPLRSTLFIQQSLLVQTRRVAAFGQVKDLPDAHANLFTGACATHLTLTSAPSYRALTRQSIKEHSQVTTTSVHLPKPRVLSWA
jgi:hypothetical protein